ncbi:hypothetical protein CO2235_20119 [Cupriavidus oxalaticus]|uniref:Uncharacterized protein n=1 Tax=Cupriavidus oxalaticus TaxID=96344 RepID=A0A375G8M1_9BURK|nr:hypothetical protein CO2235_20119 [Cupriavidus oxalaticus]
MAEPEGQAAGGAGHLHHPVGHAQHCRVQVVQAVPEFVQPDQNRFARSAAAAAAPRPVRSHRRHGAGAAGNGGGSRQAADGRARRPAAGPARHRGRPLRARARTAVRRPGRNAGGRNAGVAPAQIQLPGHGPARLGQRADPLRGRADQPGSAAQVPDLVPQPQRVPRAMRRADLHGRAAAVQAGEAGGVCALHAAWGAGYQSVPDELQYGLAGQQEECAAVGVFKRYQFAPLSRKHAGEGTGVLDLKRHRRPPALRAGLKTPCATSPLGLHRPPGTPLQRAAR